MKRKRKLLSCFHRAEIRHFLRCSRAATVKKCTKKHDARAKLLFCLLNLLRFFSVLVDVAVVVAEALYCDGGLHTPPYSAGFKRVLC